MYWFIRNYFILLLLASFVNAAEKEEQDSQQADHVKVTNDDEFLRCFKDKGTFQHAPAIKQLHIAYKIPSILLNGLLPESEHFVQPQIKELELLSLNIKGKDYHPVYTYFYCRSIQVPLQHISNLRCLTSLDLSHTRLTEELFAIVDISPLATLPKLTTLILRNTGLKRFLDFRKFSSLTELDVSHNNFYDTLPGADLSNLSTLIVLNISHTNLDNFLGGYSYLSNLEELNVEYNYELRLPNLVPLAKLKKLNIADSKNFQNDKLDSLSALQNLEIINLSGNGVYARNFATLLKMDRLSTIHMSREKYGRMMNDGRFFQDNQYINLSDLIAQTNKNIIICDATKAEQEDDERASTYDVDGLVTTEDFIEYDRRWSRSHY